MVTIIRRRAPTLVPRRALLRRAAGLAAAAFLAPAARAQSPAPGNAGRMPVNPFTLGVASGSPAPDGVVLWTRLAPEPLTPNGGLVADRVPVRWEVARDERFAQVVRRGEIAALPGRGFSVHAEVTGLEPARGYFYRFMTGAGTSPVGRTRTAPPPGAAVARLRFAVASCQQFEQGFYAAYRHMAAEELDLVTFVGDYIYESSWGARHVRHHQGGEPTTLEAYRTRYAQYKSDADLQRMHAACPWLVTWDDHEVDNDYAGLVPEDLAPDFLARRTAAYQAYFEHMPLRARQRPQGPGMRLYDRYAFGSLATFHVLDDRQYRTRQPCPAPGRGGARTVADCAARLDPAQTMLGAEQERWLDAGLAATRPRWTVIAQQTLMAQLDRRPAGDAARSPSPTFWTDGWDGYPLARRRLLEAIVRRRAPNPLVVGGDVHSSWIADLKTDFDDPRAPTVATEVCGTSITSQGPSPASIAAALQRNPHIRFADGDKRGYVTIELTPATARIALRGLDDVKQADSGITTLASFVVENGRPGAQRA